MLVDTQMPKRALELPSLLLDTASPPTDLIRIEIVWKMFQDSSSNVDGEYDYLFDPTPQNQRK